LKSLALQVGHPIQPLPDMRRADARSAQIGSRDGISHAFQVSEYSGEPFTSSLACNLLTKDCCRAALRDEAEELRPQVALVFCSESFTCTGKGLTGT